MKLKKSLQLPLFYYPTTVLLVEDDESFRETTLMNFPPNYLVDPFADPQKAADFFHQYLKEQETQEKTLHYLTHIEDVDIEADFKPHTAVDMTIFPVHEIVYNPRRFKTISVLVVDRSMPRIDGLDFCRTFQTSSAQKLLMTATPMQKEAIQAFNEGVIHHFIEKNELSFFDDLNEAIHCLQQDYFNSLTQSAMDHLNTRPHRCFKDAKFIELFYALIEKQAFVEYYLIDYSGSYLLFTKEGEPALLAVKSEEDMQNDYQLAEDNGAAKTVIQALKTREKLLFLFSPKDYARSESTWGHYLHPAQILTGEKGNKFYYSLILKPAQYKDIQLKKVVSLEAYLKTHSA